MVFSSSFLTLTKWERARTEVHRQKPLSDSLHSKGSVYRPANQKGRDFLKPSKVSWPVLTAHNPNSAKTCDCGRWKNAVCEQGQFKTHMGTHLQSQHRGRWSRRMSSSRSAWVTRQSSWTWSLISVTSVLSRQRWEHSRFEASLG